MVKSLIFILACVLGVATSWAQDMPRITPEKIEEIDAFVETRLAELGLPGAALALIQDGEVVHSRGFGVTEFGGEAITPDTPFELGSVSKSFAAIAILLLAADNELSLDDPVVQHLHRFQTDRPFRSDQITIRHALTHRSGISTYDGNRTQTLDDASPAALTTAVRGLSSIQLRSDPGEAYVYANANYLVLGAIVERVSGQPYEVFVRERILDLLNMKNSWAGPTPEERVPGARPHRYWFGEARLHKAKQTRVNMAYGGMRSSANDLARYLLAVSRDDNGLLSAEARQSMFTAAGENPEDGYGFGWMLAPKLSHNWIYHTGANPGFSTIAGFSPDAEYGVVVLTNGQAHFAAKQIDSLTLGVVALVQDAAPKPAQAPLIIRVLRWGLVALPFVCAIWIGLTAWTRFYWGFTPLAEMTLREMGVRLALPSLCLFALFYTLYILLPQVNGAPMPAIGLFMPDLGVLLTVGAFSALVAGFARLGLRLWPQPR